MELMKWAPVEGHDDVVYVYLLTNDINGKQYVGIAWNPAKRWDDHIECDSAIGKALRKYGFRNFTKEVIEVSSRKGALELETHYCEIYDCLAPNGYNIRAGGIGRTCTSEIMKNKLSVAKKGIKIKPCSQERREKLSAATKGKKRKPWSQERRDKHEATNKGKPAHNRGKPSPLKGEPLSQKTKDKISEANKGKIKSQEHREKISAAKKGKKLSNTANMKGPKAPWTEERKAARRAQIAAKKDKSYITN